MPKQADPKLRERLEVVKDLIAVFKFERVVYLTITLVSFVTLMICAILILAGERGNGALPVTLLFGSSGAISYTGARLLKMWSDALKFLLPVVRDEV